MTVETDLSETNVVAIGHQTPHTVVIVDDGHIVPDQGTIDPEVPSGGGHGHHEGHGVGIGPETFVDGFSRSRLDGADLVADAVDRIDRLADLARAACAADARAQRLFSAEMSRLAAETAGFETAGKIAPRRLTEVGAAPAHSGYRRFCAGPVLDILTAASIDAGIDAERLATNVAAIEEFVLRSAIWAEATLTALQDDDLAFAELSGDIAGETRGQIVATRLAAAESALPAPPGDVIDQTAEAIDFRHRIADMADAWRELETNPLYRWALATAATDQNVALECVEPRRVVVGDSIRLKPRPGQAFDWPPDERIEALFSGPGAQVSVPFDTLSADAATLTVPISALVRSVMRFVRVPSDEDRDTAKALLAEWSVRFAGDWAGSRLESYQHHQIPTLACLPPEARLADLTLDVDMPASIGEVYWIDADRPGASGPAALAWRGFAPSPNARVRVTLGDLVLGEDLPIDGEVPLPIDEDIDIDDLAITVLDAFGERTVRVKDLTPYLPRPTITPKTELRLDLATRDTQADETAIEIGPVDGWTKGWTPSSFIILRLSSAPKAPNETVWIDLTANSAQVQFVASRVALTPNQPSVDIGIRALSPGKPGVPVRIRASAAASASHMFVDAEFDLYIVPEGGRWSTRGQSQDGTLAVHAALLEDETVLFFNPAAQDGFDRRSANDLDHMEIGIFDPNSGTASLQSSPMNPLRNLFCAGHAHLPDGRLLSVGGHIIQPANLLPWNWSKRHLSRGSNGKFVYIYDPARNAASGARWLRMPPIAHDRWYPTITCMPDGMMLITSGSSAALLPFHDFGAMVAEATARPGKVIHNIADGLGLYKVAREYEFFNPRTNTIVQPPKGRDRLTQDKNFATYPHVFVLPQGKALHQGGVVMTIDRDRAHLHWYIGKSAELVHARTVFLAQRSIRTFPLYGSAVLLTVGHGHPTARVLVVGGGDERDRRPKRDRELFSNSPATDTAELLEFDPESVIGQQPGLSRPKTLRMKKRRFMSDAVLLPDGGVFVCGGSGEGYANANRVPIFEAELYQPSATGPGRFKQMATASSERRYHSTALLLPNATVLNAGSTRGFPPEEIKPNKDIDIWEPPYLWRGQRPVIHVASSFDYGKESIILLDRTPKVERVVLMRLGSVTHANNMDQRCVNLEIVEQATPKHIFPYITVKGPVDGTVAPPGPYMLFAISAAGVPSKGYMVRL
jgi:hypothetical protein